MSWQLIAIVAPLFFVAYQSLSKFLPSNVSPFLVNMYVSLIGAVVMFVLFLATSPEKSLSLGAKYLPIALAIGVLVSVGNAAIIKAYGLGAPQSLFSSTFYPLLIVYALAFGLLFWHEKVNLMQGLGILLTIGGMFLISYFKT
ncbi:MAG: EamA family transporter [Candidatus Pacebacteria bacterium]|nr:EamA family transporter [Candidatus Paceibacterota bacterium]